MLGPVLRAVNPGNATPTANYAWSDQGSLVYVSASASLQVESELLLVDRTGAEEVLPAPPRNYRYPRFSPDGNRIVVQVNDDGPNLYIYDIPRRRLEQLTFDGGQVPLWTPDGERITFLGNAALLNIASDFSGGLELLSPPSEEFGIFGPYSWSPDETVLFWDGRGGVTQLTPTSDGQAEHASLLTEPYDERHANFSPDGDWFSFVTTESLNPDVYVQPYPLGTGQKRMITIQGGDDSVWARNGDLFYIDRGQLWSMAVRTEPTLDWDDPVPLFPTPWTMRIGPFVNYDAAPDGQRFVVLRPTEAEGEEELPTPQINIILNWFEELKERVPVP